MSGRKISFEQNLNDVFDKSKTKITITLGKVKVYLDQDYDLDPIKLSSVVQNAEVLARTEMPVYRAEFGKFCCLFATVSSSIIKYQPVELKGTVDTSEGKVDEGARWVNAIYAFFAGAMYCHLPLEKTSDEGAARVIRYLAASRKDDALLQSLSAARIFRDAYVRKNLLGSIKMIAPKSTHF